MQFNITLWLNIEYRLEYSKKNQYLETSNLPSQTSDAISHSPLVRHWISVVVEPSGNTLSSSHVYVAVLPVALTADWAFNNSGTVAGQFATASKKGKYNSSVKYYTMKSIQHQLQTHY